MSNSDDPFAPENIEETARAWNDYRDAITAERKRAEKQLLASDSNSCLHCCQRCGAVCAFHARSNKRACQDAEDAPFCRDCAP